MAEKDTIFSGKVQNKGIFNYKDFYAFASDWLRQEGYSLTEKKYSEEIVGGDAKNIEIFWEAKKKISDYFQFLIQLRWIISGLKNIEAQKEGKRIKTNSGFVEIRLKGVLIKDYEHRWEDQPFWKFLRGIYNRYIIKSRIDQYEDDIKEETEEFIAECKAFLALEGK